MSAWLSIPLGLLIFSIVVLPTDTWGHLWKLFLQVRAIHFPPKRKQ